MNSPGKRDDLKKTRLFSGSTSTGKWKISWEFRTFIEAWIRNWDVGIVSGGSRVRKYGRKVVKCKRSRKPLTLYIGVELALVRWVYSRMLGVCHAGRNLRTPDFE